ncbi:uncharacterized protein LOC142750338 [Rhinoderma darwinii]|uniref:uncharacterized protein LOC142750338 n=1 Tax=Rhinoderma darwinii TaxID=43563 RepID=UPI003F67AF1D
MPASLEKRKTEERGQKKCRYGQSVISQLRVKTDDCDYCDFSGFGYNSGGHFIRVKTVVKTMWTGHSASVRSAYMNITPEEHLRRLAYCVKLLPSPLYKKDRLMPTSPEAQRKYLIKEEEQPGPSMEEKEQQERAKIVRELCKDLEEVQTAEENIKPRREKRRFRVRTIKLKNNTKRSRIRQSTIQQHVNQYMRGKRNIIWTILLKPLCR